jgi:hypothetical protein
MMPKFRAWLRDEKKMVEIEELDFEDNSRGSLYRVIYSNYSKLMSAEYPRDCILMQSTGFMDKKGREIYEGDILKTDEAGWIGMVVYDSAHQFLTDYNGGYSEFPSWANCKIIGNVYENKELVDDMKRKAEAFSKKIKEAVEDEKKD